MILLNFCTKCHLLIEKYTYKASQMISIKGLYQTVSEDLWKPSATVHTVEADILCHKELKKLTEEKECLPLR